VGWAYPLTGPPARRGKRWASTPTLHKSRAQLDVRPLILIPCPGYEGEVTGAPNTPSYVMMDPIQARYIGIRTLPDREVVAALDVLSPSNKSGRGRVEYLDKRDE
jgi:hypothetical protein